MPERLTTQERPRLAYSVQLEIDEYQNISRLEGTIPLEEYAQRLLIWKQEKILNQQTNLGERYNAQLFEVNYPAVDGRLVNPFRDEPMLNSLVTGQQQRLSRNLDHDDKRELVEVETFCAVESYFAQNSGILVVPSPPGGSFDRNYVDVYSDYEQGGKKFVKMQRFPTDLSAQQHWEVAQKLTSEPLGAQQEHEPDVQIKTLVLEANLTIEQLRALYTPDRNTITVQKYQEITNVTNPQINFYIDSIIAGRPLKEIHQNHNAIIKSADIFMGKDTDSTYQITRSYLLKESNAAHIAAVLGQQDIIPVKTGCGLQGAPASSIGKIDLIASNLFLGPQNNLFSTGEEDKSDFPCPKCGYTITYGAGIKQCPGCGLEATCA